MNTENICVIALFIYIHPASFQDERDSKSKDLEFLIFF